MSDVQACKTLVEEASYHGRDVIDREALRSCTAEHMIFKQFQSLAIESTRKDFGGGGSNIRGTCFFLEDSTVSVPLSCSTSFEKFVASIRPPFNPNVLNPSAPGTMALANHSKVEKCRTLKVKGYFRCRIVLVLSLCCWQGGRTEQPYKGLVLVSKNSLTKDWSLFL
jgi:hypothetical protein